jgi:hypothetical protein
MKLFGQTAQAVVGAGSTARGPTQKFQRQDLELLRIPYSSNNNDCDSVSMLVPAHQLALRPKKQISLSNTRH